MGTRGRLRRRRAESVVRGLRVPGHLPPRGGQHLPEARPGLVTGGAAVHRGVGRGAGRLRVSREGRGRAGDTGESILTNRYTGSPLHRENWENGGEKIPWLGKYRNLEILPKHRETQGIWFAQVTSCNFPDSKSKGYLCSENFPKNVEAG